MTLEESQVDVWAKHSGNITVEDIIDQYHRPQLFQSELSELLIDLSEKKRYKTSLEAGCESGITSMLLEGVTRSFLDLNPDILRKVEIACSRLALQGEFFHQDIMAMSFEDGYFDLVFNAGVIEHFSESDRVKMLSECARVMSDNGTMVVAIPNHYSLPYRIAYVIKKDIQKGKRWPWPKEFKILDLKSELAQSGLELKERRTIAKTTIYDFFGKNNPIKFLLKFIGLFVKYEGYLTVLVIQKQLKEKTTKVGVTL